MKRMVMVVLSGIFIALACYSVYKALNVDEKQLSVKPQQHEINGRNIGRVTVKDMNGNDQKLSSYLKSEINIINIWASWCEPCNKEMPELVKYDELKPNHVTLIGMNIQDKKQNRNAFIKKYHADYPMMIGSESFIKTNKLYVIPTTLFVDKEGKVITTYSGELDAEKIKTLIKDL